MRVGTTKDDVYMKVLNCRFGERRYVRWRSSCFVSSSTVDITVAQKIMLCFGKLQQGVTFSSSRMALEVWCIALDKVCL